jgi:hypothetical protein
MSSILSAAPFLNPTNVVFRVMSDSVGSLIGGDSFSGEQWND